MLKPSVSRAKPRSTPRGTYRAGPGAPKTPT